MTTEPSFTSLAVKGVKVALCEELKGLVLLRAGGPRKKYATLEVTEALWLAEALTAAANEAERQIKAK